MRGKIAIDLCGLRFGMLYVKERDTNKKNGTYWICICDCGKIKSFRSDVLRKRGTTHCGCEDEIIHIGDRVYHLVVIEKLGRIREHRKDKAIYWLCKCDCGNTTKVPTNTLNCKKVKSCGCAIKYFIREKYGPVGDIKRYIWTKIVTMAHSHNKDLEFSITPEFLSNLINKQNYKCAITGVEIRFPINSRKTTESTASLDRIDSNKGYTEDNVQWVHKTINIMKNKLPEKEFINWCKLVTEWNK